MFEQGNWLKDLLKIILLIFGVSIGVSFVIPFPYSLPVIIGLVILFAWLIRRRTLKATVQLKCDHCESNNQVGSAFCKKCGSKLDHYCKKCGNRVTATTVYCERCGKIIETQSTESESNKDENGENNKGSPV
jgi:hypothetical protein